MFNLTKRQLKILSYIIDCEKYITANRLAIFCDVSIRTIKSEIVNINQVIKKYNCLVGSKTSQGYFFVKQKYFNQKNFNDLIKKKNNIPNSYYERLIYIIKKLLYLDGFIKFEELCEELFIARTTLEKIVREVKLRLKQFNLVLSSKPNYGIYLEGNEKNKRAAIAEYFFNEAFLDGDNVYSKYYEIIKKVLKNEHIEVSNLTLNNLVINIVVSIQRIKDGNYIKDYELEKIDNIEVEFKVSKKILGKLSSYFFPKEEVLYLAQHIYFKKIMKDVLLSQKEKNKLEKCLDLIINEVNNNFGLTFSKNDDWYNYVFLHIPQMIMRINYNMTIKNPLTRQLLGKYLFATKVTHSATSIIEQLYDVKVNIDEFSYLLLYFNLAITKFELNKKIKIGLVPSYKRPEVIMMANEIKEYFSSSKYEFEEIKSFNDHKYDFIVSTKKLKKVLKVKQVVVDLKNYLEKIQEKIYEIRYKNLQLDIFLKEEYCFFGLDGENKDEVEQNFYQNLYDKNLIQQLPKEYNKCFDDELGNGIVHFQDGYRIVRKNMCYICVLKKPVLWNKEIVRILILTKTKKDNDKDLYNLCRIVSKWTSDKALINNFLKQQNFNHLLQDFKSVL